MSEGLQMTAAQIERSILLVRGHRVIVDADLAALYGVETRSLNRAVKRNRERFPPDFMFQLTPAEGANLRCQFGTSSWQPVAGPLASWGGRRYQPYVFSEQGVAMLSSVLRSRRAVLANIEIMRTFVRLRAMLASHKDLARKLEALEKKYDSQYKVVFDTIRRLMMPADPARRQIGFGEKA